MKEQELFELDSIVFREKEAEKKNKKRRRKRYAKRKRKDSETGRSQEQQGSQSLESEAEEWQNLSTAEENSSSERLKEETGKELAIESDAQLKAENLQEKGKELSAECLINGNVLKDDEIGKVEDLSEKKLEVERESSDENVHHNLRENYVEKQDVEQPAETDNFNSEAYVPDSKNYFSDVRTDIGTTDDVFNVEGLNEREVNSTFSNRENFPETLKSRENQNTTKQRKSKAAYYRHQNRRRYYKNRNQYASKENVDDRQSENKTFTNETGERFSNQQRNFSKQLKSSNSENFSSEQSSFSSRSESKKADNSTFQSESSQENQKVSKKLDTFQKKAQRAEEKLEREKGKLPKKRKVTVERTFDEASGRGK